MIQPLFNVVVIYNGIGNRVFYSADVATLLLFLFLTMSYNQIIAKIGRITRGTTDTAWNDSTDATRVTSSIISGDKEASLSAPPAASARAASKIEPICGKNELN